MHILKPQLKAAYLPIISLLGFAILYHSAIQIPSFPNKLDLLFILLLAAISQLVASTSNLEHVQAYEVGSAIGMATIPIYGPFGAALAGAASGFGIWLAKINKYRIWKDSIQVVCFNIGMFSVSMLIAGWVFVAIQNQFELVSFPDLIIPWVVAAIVNDQLNLFILAGVLRFEQGVDINLKDYWQENLWAAVINIAIASLGGGLLSSAMRLFGWKGIAIFFMPIILSSFSFRLYVRQMQSHLDNLESIIAERTHTLQDLMKEKDAFLAVLTHDMKSPLTSIGIYVDMIRKFPNLPIQKPHSIETIASSQQSLLNIVNNILDLEKLQIEGGIPLDKTVFDLIPTIESTVESLRLQATRKNIHLQFEPETLSVNLTGDQHQIERVMHNLLSNAVKYTPKEGNICVSLQVQMEKICLQVTDTGYGIPAEELPFIFDRYRRVPGHERLAVGTGLGLAITKGIVEAHGGEISVESENEVGSTFTVMLPL
ncbi:MAG: sensor histidine kinase [Chloroflexi bacterium]|nr:MAG: sensor histidine kinase [Chloroflexota bacterium]